MDKSLFFKKLFEPDEGICSGDFKAIRVSNDISGNFFSINPLKDSRADLNVTCFRNFLFEMDTISLEDQASIWLQLSDHITSLVFSGGKSYHAIISLEEPLEASPHTRQGVDKYKAVWNEMRDALEVKVGALGFISDGDVFDPACKNPSRLSRLPGARRENNKNTQSLIFLFDRLKREKFVDLFKFDYDDINIKSKNSKKVLFTTQDVTQFWKLCPAGLKNELRYVDWAASAGLYPKILKLTYWAIDSTGVDQDTFIEALWQRTFPRLLDAGYPEEKLTVAVEHAYEQKRRD